MYDTCSVIHDPTRSAFILKLVQINAKIRHACTEMDFAHIFELNINAYISNTKQKTARTVIFLSETEIPLRQLAANGKEVLPLLDTKNSVIC